jgi:hypothetical protein
MSVVVQEVFGGVAGVTQQVGPTFQYSASPWRILAMFGAGTGTVTLKCGVSPNVYTILEDTFTDERILPTVDNPFPITVGNSVVTCELTAGCAVRLVYEDNIG